VQSQQMAQQIAHLILDKKGQDVVIMNLKKLTTMADYFVITSANSDVQAKAITEHIQTKLSEEAIQPWHVEGLGSLTWVLLDFIDVVVHIFQPDTRDFYGLERLWGDAEIHEIKDPDATSTTH
jgi:ribosome-associated protein